MPHERRQRSTLDLCQQLSGKPRSSAAKDWVLEEAIRLNEFDPTATSHYGDVSAVIMQNLPPWAEFIRTPSLEVALMGDWEDKN